MAARKSVPATQPKSEPRTVGQTIAQLRGFLTAGTKITLDQLYKSIADFRNDVLTGGIAHTIEWKGQSTMIAERVLVRIGNVLRIVAGLDPMPEAATETIETYIRGQIESIERNLLENGHYLNQSTCPLRNVATHCDHQAEIQSRKILKETLKELDEIARLSRLDPNAAD